MKARERGGNNETGKGGRIMKEEGGGNKGPQVQVHAL